MTDARAQLDKTVKNASETKKTTISSDVVAKLVKEAGTREHHDYPDNKERFRQSDEQRICQCEGSAGRQKADTCKS